MIEQKNIVGLLKRVESLKSSRVKNIVDSRIKEFKKISGEEIFKELCFCLLTANYNAEKSIRIQRDINDGFLTMPANTMTEKLTKLGHRFPNTRAKYIVEARKYKESLEDVIKLDGTEARERLVENVKGLGYKEASHFLRNIGFDNLAIIDFHIIDILERHKLIEKPMTLTKKKYLEIEVLLKEIAEKTNLSLAELDLYLWYNETGKVLK